MDKPYILDENENYAVVFKPAKMHSASKDNIYHNGAEGKEDKDDEQKLSCAIARLSGMNLLEWYASCSDSVFDIMHRLDYETHGLVLFAKNEKSYLFLKEAQEKDEFIKEYSAICTRENRNKNEGFPQYNFVMKDDTHDSADINNNTCISAPPRHRESNFNSSFVIESYFRPYGSGRKLVRPVIEYGKKHKEIAKDRGGFYRTEIISKNGNNFTIRIKRGFRHQIRCHLCWIGFPILNDPLYSRSEEAISLDSVMALRSHALFFPDPSDGKKREYRIEGCLTKQIHPVCE